MTDICDRAAVEEERERAENLRRQANKRRLSPRGNCYNCAAVVARNSLFCDADCKEYFERRERAKKNK